MDDNNDKIKITFDELYDSRIDEEIFKNKSANLSPKVEKVQLFSKFDNRILIKIGIILICLLLIGFMIIWFRMKHLSPEQPSIKTKIYKADLSSKNREYLIYQTKSMKYFF